MKERLDGISGWEGGIERSRGRAATGEKTRGMVGLVRGIQREVMIRRKGR